MKSFRDLIIIKTEEQEEIVNITQKVREMCRKSGIKEGLIIVFSHHTSSAIYISDSDFRLTRDYQKILNRLVPNNDYEHDCVDHKKNAAGHLKSVLNGLQVIVPITSGELDLGAYQTIYYVEFDGKREKEILVKIIGE
ncbi:MAG: secondary thiamine-phosphate synthase enzyme YjbQ [bacterium]|nr:secondary thiamine-phosphate synthase enzyme YjbQ [bacterium]